MSIRGDLRHGFRIGRAEFLRSVRWYVGSTRRILGLGASLLFFGGYLMLFLPTVYFWASSLQSVGNIELLGFVMTAFPLGFLLITVLRSMERISKIEHQDLILTTVTTRATVVGLLLAEVLRLSIWFGIPLLLIALVFAFGVGSPLVLFTGLVVVAPMVVSTAVWGYAAGLGLLSQLRRLPSLRGLGRGAMIIFVGLAVVLSQVFARYFVGNGSFVSLLSGYSFPPLRMYGELIFVGSPVTATLQIPALLVLVGWVVSIPFGLVAAEKMAGKVWFGGAGAVESLEEQETEPSEEDGEQLEEPRTGFSPWWPFRRSKPGRIGWAYLVRGVRRPQEFAHLLLILFFMIPSLGSFATDHSTNAIATLAAGVAVTIGAYLSGGMFGLNPIGEDSRMFPLLLTTVARPEDIVKGRMFAGLAIGLPLATLIPLVILGGLLLYPLLGLGFAVMGLVFCFSATGFASGIGCIYPIHEERMMWGQETIAPSTIVLLTYTFVVIGGSVIGLYMVWVAWNGFSLLNPFILFGLAIYLALLSGIPFVGYRYSLRRYRNQFIE